MISCIFPVPNDDGDNLTPRQLTGPPLTVPTTIHITGPQYASTPTSVIIQRINSGPAIGVDGVSMVTSLGIL